MSMKKQAVAVDEPHADPLSQTGDNRMEQIRDLLFGSVARDYERRFAELSERISREVSRMDLDMERRFSAMDARLDALAERVAAQLRQESSSRAAALDDLEARLTQALRTQRTEWNASIERMEGEMQALGAHARAETDGLRADMQKSAQTLRDTMANEREILQGAKVGREDLADLMVELSVRLRGGDLGLPELP